MFHRFAPHKEQVVFHAVTERNPLRCVPMMMDDELAEAKFFFRHRLEETEIACLVVLRSGALVPIGRSC